MVSVGPRECPGAFRCPSGDRCFAEAARDAAAAADVVVVNTHLYGAHLASGGAVLPAHDVVVFDEAHELEEVMTVGLGVEVTPGRFRALAASARPLVDAATDADLLAVDWLSAGRPIGAACWPTGWAPGSCTTTPEPPVDDRGAGRRCWRRAAELAGRVTDAGAAARAVDR